MSVKKRVFVVGRLQGLRSRPASTCASIFKMGKLDHPSRTAAVFLSLSLFFCLSSARSYEEDVAANHREFFEGTQYFKEVIDMSRGRTVVRVGATPPPLRSIRPSIVCSFQLPIYKGGSLRIACFMFHDRDGGQKTRPLLDMITWP